MNDLDVFTRSCPDVGEFDPAVKAAVRRQLFGEPIGTRAPDAATPAPVVTELVSPMVAGHRRWKVVFAAAAAAIVVAGLISIAARSSSSTPTNQPATTATAGTTNSTGSTSLVTDPHVATTSPTDPHAEPALPPGISVDATVPVFAPPPNGDTPMRSDPIERWLHPVPFQSAEVWFIRNDSSGRAVGGVSVEVQPATEWSKTFQDAPVVNVPGVDARLVQQSIGWRTDGGLRAVRQVGDVTIDELTQIAAAVEVAGSGPFTAPAGFIAVSPPIENDTVSYNNEHIAVETVHDATESPASAYEIAFMSPGRSTDVIADPTSDRYSIRYTQAQLIVFRTSQGITLMNAPLDANIPALIDTITYVPTTTVPVRQYPPADTVPDDATRRFGEIALGRWTLATFTNDAGLVCRDLRTNFPGGGGTSDCGPAQAENCPIINSGGGIDQPATTIGLIPYEATNVQLQINGSTINSTVEQSNGYTFVYATLDTLPARTTITVNGQTLCPNG